MKGKDKGPPSDYEVGYGKPPKHSQFKKGETGCRRGRTPKSEKQKSLADQFREMRFNLTEDGIKRKVGFSTALVAKYTNLALQGDIRAANLVLKMLELAGGLNQLAETSRPLGAIYVNRDAVVLASLGVVYHEGGVSKIRTPFAELALSLMTAAELAALDFRQLGYCLEDPSILDRYKPPDDQMEPLD